MQVGSKTAAHHYFYHHYFCAAVVIALFIPILELTNNNKLKNQL